MGSQQVRGISITGKLSLDHMGWKRIADRFLIDPSGSRA
jgi:hypothetical protein